LPKRAIPKFDFVSDGMAAVLREKTGAERLEIAFGMIRSARARLEYCLRRSSGLERRRGPAGCPAKDRSAWKRVSFHAVRSRLSTHWEFAIFVTCSVAAMFYGKPRFTNHVDVVSNLPFGQIRDLCAAFPAPDFYISEESARRAVAYSGQFNVIHPRSGLKLD
jgi:hypothetical protein